MDGTCTEVARGREGGRDRGRGRGYGWNMHRSSKG